MFPIDDDDDDDDAPVTAAPAAAAEVRMKAVADGADLTMVYRLYQVQTVY